MRRRWRPRVSGLQVVIDALFIEFPLAVTQLRGAKRRSTMKQLQPLCAVACLLMASGCGSSADELDLIPVRGEVTYNGQPLGEGTVVYLPETSSEGRQASGAIQSDGSFSLTTQKLDDGVKAGSYQIAVLAYKPQPAEPQSRVERDTLLQQKGERGYIIPEKYTNPTTSGLTDVVGADHSGFKKIELTD